MRSIDIIGLIMRHEGYRQFPYKDIKGIWTIGYGRNLESNGISEEEAEYLLEEDCKNIFYQLVKHEWFNGLTHNRQAVIIDMSVNLGVNGMLKFKKMIAAIKRGEWLLASDEILDSKAARQLPNRYSKLSKIMADG